MYIYMYALFSRNLLQDIPRTNNITRGRSNGARVIKREMRRAIELSSAQWYLRRHNLYFSLLLNFLKTSPKFLPFIYTFFYIPISSFAYNI